VLCLQGPRIAHWLLPIPKNRKVGSEWWYAWVPVLGPLVGGVLAGAVFKGYVNILKGQVSVDSNPWATTSLGASSVTAALNVSQPITNNATLAAPGSVAAGAGKVTDPEAGGSLGTLAKAAKSALPKLF
jgi:hypothetical protein